MNWLRKLTKCAFPAMDGPVPTISPQEAYDTCDQIIGPLYHGSAPEVIPDIKEQGFKWEEGGPGVGSPHGYPEGVDFHEGCPPPVHHLGYGIYLTQNRVIARNFGYDSMRNVLEFRILKNARVNTINFGAPRTMMKWWTSSGYDCELAKTDRIAATKQLTDNLSSQFDAVLYKGKGLHRLLDGNQVCIYNPSILRTIDKKLARAGEIGSKVTRKQDGMVGTLLGMRSLKGFSHLHNNEPGFLVIKWQRGGTDMNVYPSDVEFGDPIHPDHIDWDHLS